MMPRRPQSAQRSPRTGSFRGSLLAVCHVAGLATGLAFAPALAHADAVDDASAKLYELDGQLTELDKRLKPPEDEKGQLAERRLIDAQVAYELKNYEAASTILYDLIEKYPTSPSFPEALYYLADSLYLKRDFFSARRFFEKLVDLGPSSGRYQDALQRLIELSLHTGDYGPVDGYLAKLSQLPQGQVLPSVPYVKGKYHYFRKQYEDAISTMRALPATHKYFMHGLYFIGASQVAMGKEHFAEALATFDSILKLDVPPPPVKAADKAGAKSNDKNATSVPILDAAQKLIVELAHLGRARILLDQGQLTAAMEAYTKIPSGSPNFTDALYESAWVSIKGKEYQRAARQLDLLLLNSPDSNLAPEVRLLSGNLYIRQNQYGAATTSFAKTRDEYEPLSKELQNELAKTGDPSAYFRDLLAKNLGKFDLAKVVPQPAVKWMKDQPPTVRLGDLLTDESDLDKSLADAEDTIKKLERAINGAGRVNVFPELARARAKGAVISNSLIELKRVIAARVQQLIESAGGAEQAELKGLTDERSSLETQLKHLPTKAESLADRQQKAKAAFNEIDKRASELSVTITGSRAQVVATNKFFHDQVERSLPVDQRKAAQLEIDQYMSEIDREQLAIDAVRKELEEAAQSVGVDDSDMKAGEELKAKYDDVVKRQQALFQRVLARLGGQDRAKGEQIGAILGRADALSGKLLAYNQKIDALAEEKLGPIRIAIGEEKTKVGEHRGLLSGYHGESNDVGGGVLAEGLRGVSQRFYNVVVRADVGIIDVAWALKDSATKETNRLVSERKRELKLLDNEFKEVLKEQP